MASKRFFLVYLFCIAATLGAIYLMRSQAVWAVALCLPLLTVPGTFALASLDSAWQAHKLKIMTEVSWLRSLRSRASYRLTVAVLISAVVVGASLPQLLSGDETTLLSVILVPILFVPLHGLRRWIAPQLHGAFATLLPIRWATVCAVGLSWLLTCLAVAYGLPDHLLPELPAAQSALVREIDGLARVTGDVQTHISGIGALWGRVVLALSTGGLAGLAGTFTAVAAMPAAELKRALARASAETVPPPLNLGIVAGASCVVVLCLWFIWTPLVAWGETFLAAISKDERHASLSEQIYSDIIVEPMRASRATETTPSSRRSAPQPLPGRADLPRLPQGPQAPERKPVAAESIAGRYYPPGTIDALQARERERLAALVLAMRDDLATAVVRASEQMERNVDAFLDDYYSLKGEYLRLGAMMMGDAEAHMAEQLTKSLAQGNPMRDFNDLHQTLADAGHIAEAFGNADLAFLNEREILPTDDVELIAVNVCEAAPCFDLATELQQSQTLVSTRLAASGVGALATGTVAALIVKKVAAKGALKLAVKALAKVASKKAVGTTIGALVGGVLGSIVPGLGTAVGVATGAALVAGLTGVALDAAMIALEETLKREQFRASLVAEIYGWRDNLLAALTASSENQGQ
ncbi:hypothetical protein Q4543_20325 [Salipiger sp. 1_MG-2023]|uniref:hypothetical protein n=1 Tax=Salipiger sp. 1_MG-2023 TaxID=3062665 RepID=UPI0026E3DCBF|nr:hypothetical protein [Salipiger sp. 1_MG-2023]MDO6587863.1 hypothetical protein [Salipiger sp. 1_MG-2023]